MGLLGRAQEIIGDKTFKSKVTIESDLILKKHATLYSPVANELSLGTLHHHPLTNATGRALVNGVALPAVGNWSAAISCPDAPVDAKALLATVLLTATANGQVVERVCFSDNNSTTPAIGTAHPMIAHSQYGGAGEDQLVSNEITIPLSPSKIFYYYTLAASGGSAYALYVIERGYKC